MFYSEPPDVNKTDCYHNLYGEITDVNSTHQGILKGEYHCTVDLLFDWFGLACFANKSKNCQ
jgi:hypothetical protein